MFLYVRFCSRINKPAFDQLLNAKSFKILLFAAADVYTCNETQTNLLQTDIFTSIVRKDIPLLE